MVAAAESSPHSVMPPSIRQVFVYPPVISTRRLLRRSRPPPAFCRSSLPKDRKQPLVDTPLPWVHYQPPPVCPFCPRAPLPCTICCPTLPPNGNGKRNGTEQSTPGRAADIFLSGTPVLSFEECRAVIRAAEEYSQVRKKRAAWKYLCMKLPERERERDMETVEIATCVVLSCAFLGGRLN